MKNDYYVPVKWFFFLTFILVGCSSDPPQETVLTYSIVGMHCSGCVQSITAEIDKIDGVTSCVVTLEENNAVVTVTDEALAQTILQNIRRLQFKVELVVQQQIIPAQEYR